MAAAWVAGKLLPTPMPAFAQGPALRPLPGGLVASAAVCRCTHSHEMLRAAASAGRLALGCD